MGCDIHLYAEHLIDGDWTTLHPHDVGLAPTAWDYDGRWFDDRDYALFAVLANVRNSYEITPISSPRGLPDRDELGFFTAAGAAYWDGDAHSHSWLMVGEIAAYDWAPVADLLPGWVGWPGDRWSDVIDALTAHPHSTRLVFWFDN